MFHPYSLALVMHFVLDISQIKLFKTWAACEYVTK